MGNARADDLSVTYVYVAAGAPLHPHLGVRSLARRARTRQRPWWEGGGTDGK